ncbi:hypothetical protein PUR31_03025 [Pseudomonas mosselii]|uniref:hypothetical protein n=1 Tax=unclassified Pseudomonas TaxID=196821 RepID=UPI0020C3EF2A|nr:MULTISPECIES: hypothetical protein [unclassified Pseudomonas]MCP8632109.1 hypothetical protein [Pseudomonas sp. DVZ6]MDD7783061.1 hypothetical protein [Pseudomonas sp. DVZ24]
MTAIYYSTTTFLTLSINKHFYGGKHFTYVAEGFFPYGRGNPKSSNPLLIYMDLYQPWQDRDPYDKFVTQHRMSVRKGILAREQDNTILPRIANDLNRVADRIHLDFFYPVVYRIKPDINALLNTQRAVLAGSGLKGSCEYLIQDLGDLEFDIYFNDNESTRYGKLKGHTGCYAGHADAVNDLLAWS